MKKVALMGSHEESTSSLIRIFRSRHMLAAVCRKNPPVAGDGGDLHDVAERTLQDILQDPEIDALVASTPSDIGIELALRCLTAGKHLMMDHAFAPDGEGIREIEGLASTHRLVLMAGSPRLFHPLISRIKTLIDSKELGTVTGMSSIHLSRRYRTDALLRRAEEEVEIATHLIGSKPLSLLTHTQGAPSCDETAMVETRALFKSGLVHKCIVSGTLNSDEGYRLIVTGDKKMAVLDRQAQKECLVIGEALRESAALEQASWTPVDDALMLESMCRSFIDRMEKAAIFNYRTISHISALKAASV